MFNKLSLTAVVVLIAVAFCLFTKANADCSVVGAYVSPQASLVLTHASNSGECKEWLFGPITETRRLKLDFLSAYVNCAVGDNLIIYNEDRTRVVFDYCQSYGAFGLQALSTSTDLRYAYIRAIIRGAGSIVFVVNFSINGVTAAPATAAPTVPSFTQASTNKPVTFPPLSSQSAIFSTSTSSSSAVVNAQCGVADFTPGSQGSRIVGGAEANPHSWPWQVKVTDGSYLCGGTLISPDWVLTAAHCVEDVSAYSLRVQLGEHSLKTNENTEQIITASQIIMYPSYTGRESDYYRGDIALVRLSRSAVINQYVKPICLPQFNEEIAPIGSSVVVTGWGKLGQFVSTSDKLYQVGINILPASSCGTGMTTAKICAGDTNQDSCNGDSGGPLQINRNGKYYLAGIVSYGSEKCNAAGVYTKVSSYMDWVKMYTNL